MKARIVKILKQGRNIGDSNKQIADKIYTLFESKLKEESEIEIDFDGNLKALIRITENGIKVLKAVNGYGDPLDINFITFKYK
jgi:hypothetical protein